MMLYIYANFNLPGEFFSSPVAEKITPDEMAKDYVQIVSGLPQDALLRLKECDLYCLGAYDNVSGIIEPKKEFILHCADACNRFIKQAPAEKDETV